jgi:hypothetical protein
VLALGGALLFVSAMLILRAWCAAAPPPPPLPPPGVAETLLARSFAIYDLAVARLRRRRRERRLLQQQNADRVGMSPRDVEAAAAAGASVHGVAVVEALVHAVRVHVPPAARLLVVGVCNAPGLCGGGGGGGGGAKQKENPGGRRGPQKKIKICGVGPVKKKNL